MNEIRLYCIVIFIVLTMMTTVPSQAGLIEYRVEAPILTTEQASTGGFSTGGGLSSSSGGFSVQLPGFDSSLGTLVDASLGFDSSFDITNRLDALDQDDGEISAVAQGQLAMQVSVQIPGSTEFLRIQTPPTAPFAETFCDVTANRCGSTGLLAGNFGGEFDNSLISELFLRDLFFVSYRWTLFSVHTCFGGTDLCMSSAASSWTGNIFATYTYDDGQETDDPVSVPEPGTLALLGSSLFGLAAMRCRRRLLLRQCRSLVSTSE